MNKISKIISVVALGSGLILAPISPVILAEQPSVTQVQEGVSVHVLDATGTKDSVMNSFMEGTQAQLVTENGVKYIQFTEKMSSAWKSFTINGVEVETVSENNTDDTRIVRFPYTGEKTLNAHVIVEAPLINYHGSYDVILQLSNIPQENVKPSTTEEITSQDTPQPSTIEETTSIAPSETKETVYLLNAKASEPTYSSMQSYIENTATVAGDKVTLKFVKRDSLEGFNVNGQPVAINEDGTATFTVTSSDVETTFDINTGNYRHSYPVKLHIGKLVTEPIVKKRPTERPSTETVKPTEVSKNVYLLNAKATEPTYSSMQSYIENMAKVVETPAGNKVTLKFIKREGIAGFNVNGQPVVINEDGTATFVVNADDINTTFEVATGNYKNSYPVKLHIGKLATEPIVKKRPTEKPSKEVVESIEKPTVVKPTEKPSVPEKVIKSTNVAKVLKYGTQELSKMDGYIKSSQIVDVNGKKYVQLVIENASAWQSFNVEGQSVTEVSSDIKNDRKIVMFEYIAGKQQYASQVHISIPAIKYDNTYNVTIVVSESGKSISKVTPSVTDNALTIHTTNEAQGTNNIVKVNNILRAFKYGTSQISVMDGYIESSEIVEVNGLEYVQLTIGSASAWKSFTVEGQPVEIVSTDVINDRQVVRFIYNNAQSLYNAQVHIVVPSFNYDNTYNVTLLVDKTGVQTGERHGVTASLNANNKATSTTGLKKGVAKSGLLPKSGEVTSSTMTYVGGFLALLAAIALFVRKNKKSN